MNLKQKKIIFPRQKIILHALEVEETMKASGNPETAAVLRSFFKTGPGQYAEGDCFLGVRNPVTRRTASAARSLPEKETEKLLGSPFHEIRLCGLLILTERHRTEDLRTKKEILDLYIKASPAAVNNWDLVDLSAPGIAGAAELTHRPGILTFFASKSSLWEQRIAIVGTLTLIRKGIFAPSLEFAVRFLNHPHDLIHKACGWMLREIGKRDRPLLTDFLNQYKKRMPRTMLRYAIEHYPEDERKEFLAGESLFVHRNPGKKDFS